MAAKHQPRPKRQRHGDRLLAPDSSANQIRCDHALAPFDRLATEMEDKWGIDRLPSLVSPATAEKYGSAIAKLNEAIRADDPEAVKLRSEVCMRGLGVMDAEATAAGAQPLDGECWEYDLEGFKFFLVKDPCQWRAVRDRHGDDAVVFSLREVAVALRAHCRQAPIEELKEIFPGAQVTKLPPLPDDFWKNGGDPIPF